MDSSDAIQLAVLLLLLGLSAFFSSAETALTTVNKIRVLTLVEEGDKRALRLQKVLDEPSKMLSAILIGNNIVNMSLSSLGTVIATKAFGSAGAGIATGILTFLVLVFGEITPKQILRVKRELKKYDDYNIIAFFHHHFYFAKHTAILNSWVI